MQKTDDGSVSWSSPRQDFPRKVWLVVGIVTAVLIVLLLLWYALIDLLAIFTGILLAVFLNGISGWLSNHSFLSRKAALFLVIALSLALLVAAYIFLVPNLLEQVELLSEQLSSSFENLRNTISDSSVGQLILNQLDQMNPQNGSNSAILSRASSIFSTTLDILVRSVVILFVGFYLAYEPATYLNGFVKLFPPKHRSRLRETLDKAGYALRWWLAGRLASMAIVGVLSIIGLTLLDVPLPFILGLLAGLLAFIPLIGPTLALVAPMLIAFTDSFQKALYVFILYMVIQFLESYVLTPLIQRRATALPPVLLICSQVILALFAGIWGVMVAAPLVVTAIVFVKLIYVEGVLNDHSVQYLEGSHNDDDNQEEGEEISSSASTRYASPPNT